jgi:hypothetical protein
MYRNLNIALLLIAWGIPAAAIATEEIDACDIEVAHPSDPDHVGDGVASADVVTHRAIPACREAIRKYPGVARFHYQLGRAIVYWAGANDGDYSEAMQHLRHAADMNSSQAQFVLGLMLEREGKVCEVEPLTRQAADQGLKSARLSYVDHVTAGVWNACKDLASVAQMTAYLDAAASQVSGYYENMLLASLRRQLAQEVKSE